jgi:hypothetical protein
MKRKTNIVIVEKLKSILIQESSMGLAGRVMNMETKPERKLPTAAQGMRVGRMKHSRT